MVLVHQMDTSMWFQITIFNTPEAAITHQEFTPS